MADIYTSAYQCYSGTPGAGDWKLLITITGLNTNESVLKAKVTIGGATKDGSAVDISKADGESTAYIVIPISCAAGKAIVATIQSTNSADTSVTVSTSIQRASVNMLALNGKLTDGTPDAEDRPVLSLKQIAIENPDTDGEGIFIEADYGIGIVSAQDGIICYSSGNGIHLYSEHGYTDTAGLNIETQGLLNPDILIGGNGLEGDDIRQVILSWILGGAARVQLDKCATRDQLEAAIWAQTRFRMSIPEKVERPESGTVAYTFGISTFDRDGALADCDAMPTVHAFYQDGSSADAKLGAITKIDGMTGLYTFTFDVADADPDYDHIRFVGAAQLDGYIIGMTDYTNIVDDASPDFTAADRTNLTAVAGAATEARLSELDPENIPAAIDGIPASILDLTDAIDGITPRQALRILGAVFGKSTGAGTTEETFTGFDGETPRVQVNTDEAGNRTSVTFFL